MASHMSKKHYELVAEAIREARADMVDYPVRVAGANQVARYIARYLRKNSSKFDRDKFLKACGIDTN